MKHNYKTYEYYIPSRVEQLVHDEVREPISGFDQKSRDVSQKEQLEDTCEQVCLAVDYYRKNGYSEEKIRRIISFFSKH